MYDEFKEKKGLDKEIEEAIRIIENFQDYSKFMNEFLIIVIFGGFLTNIISSVIIEIFTATNPSDVIFTIFGISIILLFSFYFIVK